MASAASSCTGCVGAARPARLGRTIVQQKARSARAQSSTVAFYHPGRDLCAAVHGDDFVFTGLDEDLDFILKELETHYEIKNRGRLGTGPKDAHEIDVLGRRVRLHEWGISWGADPRPREKVLEHFGLSED